MRRGAPATGVMLGYQGCWRPHLASQSDKRPDDILAAHILQRQKTLLLHLFLTQQNDTKIMALRQMTLNSKDYE